MRKNKLYLSTIFLVLLTLIVYAYTLPAFFKFNKKNALKEWQERVFRNKVLYMVEPEKEGGYLIARSKNACSGLLYKIRFDPKKRPLISWKWRVLKFPEKIPGEDNALMAKNPPFLKRIIALFKPRQPLPKPETGISAKPAKGGWLERDDYAARIYVIFPSWIFSNIKSIEYVWDETKPKNTIVTSPYFQNIKLIVAESGKKNNNDWVTMERNIYEDYRRAFGKEPTWVGAIALMTDTDNTVSTAEAEYTDIKVGYNK